MNNQEKLYWKFDVSTFKLLGRELITDRITAVYELVKNCYDANATKVELLFTEVTKRSDKSTIIIRDNGIGMSIDDIKNKWMVVGTSSKRGSQFSPKPFNRRYIGEKGVGRFAVDKLGGHLHIRTKREGDTQVLNVIINWEEYEDKMKNQLNLGFQEFTKVENEFYFEEDNDFLIGTELKITRLHEAWDSNIIGRLYDQLSKILSPTHQATYPFKIFIDAPDYEKQEIKTKPLEDFATYSANIPFDKESGKQGSLVFNEKEVKFEIDWIAKPIFGFITINYYFFDTEAIKKLRAYYPNMPKDVLEGVKIYRDGVICTPFAEALSELGNRRDVLGIDKRRYNDAFEKISNRELIGIIEITRNENDKIIDATNRQDFVYNDEYTALKLFNIQQIDEFTKYRKYYREKNKERVQNNLRQATADVKTINKEIKKIVKENPQFATILDSVSKLSERVEKTVKEGVKEQEEERKDFTRKENIYLSLMSLQDYATNLAHAIRLLLGKIKRGAEFFKTHYPNPNYEAQFLRASILIYEEMNRMSKVVDFMLSYAAVDITPIEINIRHFLEELLFESYLLQLEGEDIKVELEGKEKLELTLSAKFLEDVFQNIIANAIKALQKTEDKKIKCEYYVVDNQLIIIFSDNGMGIKEGDEDKIFDIYYTTTAEQGGAGLGLYIAQKRMEALQGSIELIPSIFAPNGASFKIILPLNDK